MYREKIEELKAWKDKLDRKPLIVRGARQVGKTYLVQEFGRTEFATTAYINFTRNERMENLFAGDFDVERLLLGLSAEAGFDIDPQTTLIIFDEVQEIPAALESLKYFAENAPEYHVVAAGSLLGVALHAGTSFPVGKVEFLDLEPLKFHEFLLALDEKQLAQMIVAQDWPLIASFKSKIIDYLKQYYYVGGMPEVVASYAEKRSFADVRDLQRAILDDYEQDFSKHAPVNLVPKIRQVWRNLPAQLARENKKFIYGLIREGARAKDYEVALMWLEDAGLVRRVERAKTPKLPLVAYRDAMAFKIYLVDVGLLAAMGELTPKTLLEKSAIFTEFKGALTEQFALSELSGQNLPIFYWVADDGKAEIDFVVQTNDEIVPIEVKAEENLQAKSLRSYSDKFAPKHAVRTSMSNYREEKDLINVPLYAVANLTGALAKVVPKSVS